MSVNREEGGLFFSWEDKIGVEGINQRASQAQRRYRELTNFNWKRTGALTKDRGLRRVSTSTLENGSHDTVAGFDAHFNDGTHKVLIFQETATVVDVYELDSSRAYSKHSNPSLAKVTPSVMQIANKVVIFDGTTLRTMDGSRNWATPGNSLSNPCKFGTVYANRLIASGNSTYPQTFFPSGIRDAGEWDGANSVAVTGVQGELIESVGRCGPYLVVGGRNFTRVYYLGTASARDWDWDSLSETTGPISFKSFVDVSLSRGNETQDYAFFWGTEGPMMIAYSGGGLPVLHSLWEPLQYAISGENYEEVAAMEVSNFTDIVASWIPETREIRFGFATQGQSGTPKNNAFWCLDFDSAVGYANSSGKIYPAWRLRNNPNMDEFPASTIFLATLHPVNGIVDSDGKRKALCARNGSVYEMDSPPTYLDGVSPDGTGGVEMPATVHRDGFTGEEDGVRDWVKSCDHVHIQTSTPGNFNLFVNVTADGGGSSVIDEANLSGGLTVWSESAEEGTWGEGRWNASDVLPLRTDHGTMGRRFSLNIYDNGNCTSELNLYSWTLQGFVEDQR